MTEQLRIDLKDLTLKGVEESDHELGRGAYGVVKECSYKGLRCAGKLIHQELKDAAESEQRTRVADKFNEECHKLSRQHHPNIVLFMGVYFKEGAQFPGLLMEYLPMSLDRALAKYRNMPAANKNVILHDVACGLSYLHGHEPPLVHRDLTSVNVLLTESIHAKISDLGVARIIHNKDEKLTQIPGNASFMPPEAFNDDPDYDKSLDMFSYGNLILHTITHTWPQPTGRVGENNHVHTELERRRAHLDQIGKEHPLLKFTESCLSNNPDKRPTAEEATEKLSQEMKISPCSFADSLQMLEQIRILTIEMKKLNRNPKQRSIQDLEARVQSLSEDANEVPAADQEQHSINSLHLELETLKTATSKAVLLHPASSLDWVKCQPLPHPRKHVQAVEFEDMLYVGSGYGANEDTSFLVYRYNISDDSWEEESLRSNTKWFAMTVFNNTVVLVSGETEEKTPCDRTQYLSQDSKEWKFYNSEEMASIPTARNGAVSASLAMNLVVAGGYDTKTRNRLNTVEVYNKGLKMWYKASSLPKACAEMKTALLDGDQWYILGGSNQYKGVFTTSLEKLTESSVEFGAGQQPPNEIWTSLTDVNNEFSSVAIFGRSLVAMGGEKEGLFRNTYFPTCYVYIKKNNSWVSIDNVPVPLSKCTAVTLTSEKMFIVGGRNRSGEQLDIMYKCELRNTL